MREITDGSEREGMLYEGGGRRGEREWKVRSMKTCKKEDKLDWLAGGKE